jgi:acyl-CoA thioester hydrolase
MGAAPSHRFPVRVYYEDTDAGGIVYYANYLKFAERARTEMLRAAGFGHGVLLGRFGGIFVVRRCVADYCQPARLDDELLIETYIRAALGARLVLGQRILRDSTLLVDLEIVLAFLDSRHRPLRMPEAVRQAVLGP